MRISKNLKPLIWHVLFAVGVMSCFVAYLFATYKISHSLPEKQEPVRVDVINLGWSNELPQIQVTNLVWKVEPHIAFNVPGEEIESDEEKTHLTFFLRFKIDALSHDVKISKQVGQIWQRPEPDIGFMIRNRGRMVNSATVKTAITCYQKMIGDFEEEDTYTIPRGHSREFAVAMQIWPSEGGEYSITLEHLRFYIDGGFPVTIYVDDEDRESEQVLVLK